MGKQGKEIYPKPSGFWEVSKQFPEPGSINFRTKHGKLSFGPTIIFDKYIKEILKYLKLDAFIPRYWDFQTDGGRPGKYISREDLSRFPVTYYFNEDYRILTADHRHFSGPVIRPINFHFDNLGSDDPRRIRPFPEILRDTFGLLAYLPDRYWSEITEKGLVIGEITAAEGGTYTGNLTLFTPSVTRHHDVKYPDAMYQFSPDRLNQSQLQRLNPVALLIDMR